MGVFLENCPSLEVDLQTHNQWSRIGYKCNTKGQKKKQLSSCFWWLGQYEEIWGQRLKEQQFFQEMACLLRARKKIKTKFSHGQWKSKQLWRSKYELRFGWFVLTAKKIELLGFGGFDFD
ncbi:hypothetical protein LXL04_035994 [Taraxacum kok-saghyz]